MNNIAEPMLIQAFIVKAAVISSMASASSFLRRAFSSSSQRGAGHRPAGRLRVKPGMQSWARSFSSDAPGLDET
ncbi:hypothetical protein AW40_27490 [Kosakonia radicincitans UMEnt01/12]|nr:hypothetical protein AW40_27490 [Kosakonia radicincitans UMEnt01/12]